MDEIRLFDNDIVVSLETKWSKYFMTLTGDVKERYKKKVLECGGIDPYTLIVKDLSVDTKDFPDITVLDIGNYMIQSPSPYTKRSFNAYKSTEAYSFFESGFVLSVGSKKINDLAILVKHSQRMNESPLKPWILASMTGTIRCAHCNCLSGQSETCSHVAAICFAISSIGEFPDIKSVTDMLCKWNIPSFKNVSMSSMKEIHWRYSTQEPNTNESNFMKYCNSITPFSDEKIDQFIKKCHSDGNVTALGTIIMPLEMRRKTLIKDEIFLASHYNHDYRNKSLLELIEIGKSISLSITHDEVKEISKITVNKEKSKFYIGLRRGRISGSNFESCCVTDVQNPSLTTINGMLNPRSLNNIPSITYQMKNRKKALQRYMVEAMSDHENFEFNHCGLIINPRLPYVVGSPDGIRSCSCHGKGSVLIKCMKLLEMTSSFEVLTVKPNNILNRTGNSFVLERNHELFYQVQLQINVISLEFCDIVLWTPKDTLIIRVESDVDFWNIAIKKALKFHEQVIMPEILAKFYTKFSDSQTNNEEDEFELVKLEIEILHPNVEQKLIELEIDILSDEEQKTEESSPEDCTVTLNNSPKCQLRSEIAEKVSQEIESMNDIPELQNVNSHSEFYVRNLMELSVDDILLTFSDHREELERLYGEHIKKPKRQYFSKNFPEFIELDIINEKQLKAMAIFAEAELVKNSENYNGNIEDDIKRHLNFSRDRKKKSKSVTESDGLMLNEPQKFNT